MHNRGVYMHHQGAFMLYKGVYIHHRGGETLAEWLLTAWCEAMSFWCPLGSDWTAL